VGGTVGIVVGSRVGMVLGDAATTEQLSGVSVKSHSGVKSEADVPLTGCVAGEGKVGDG
jgi:hypothetical protein